MVHLIGVSALLSVAAPNPNEVRQALAANYVGELRNSQGTTTLW